jgi:DNA-binding PadR family transcriptional regulator
MRNPLNTPEPRQPGARHQHRGHHPADMFDGPREGMPHRGRGRGPGRGGRGRAPRGDVRTAILLLLAEEPMHGYQLMQAIAERSGGRWTPSPGAIYPAINLLEDEDLVTVTAESGRKVVTLTESGRALVESQRESWVDPFVGFDERGHGPDLRGLLVGLHEATRQVGRTGSADQVSAAAKILSDARRAMYLVLADGPATDDE